MDPLSDSGLDAAISAFTAHSNAQSFLNHPTRKFVCNECDAELAEFVDLRRHAMREAIIASHYGVSAGTVES